MCGAIVLAYSSQGMSASVSRISTLASHLTYNAGRVLSYAIVGAFLGMAGKGVMMIHGVAEWFSLAVGALLIIAGVVLLRVIPFARFDESLPIVESSRSVIKRLYRASFGALVALPKLESKFYIGLLTPLLPCGLLYSMFLKAAETGSALEGGIMMALFGLGIVPALLVTGYASTFLGESLRRWGDKLAAVTIILMGLMLFTRGMGIPLPWMGGGHH
jgi:hypothetical protein